MGGEWQEVTIETIASHIAMGPFGSDIKTENFVANGVPVIRGTNLTTGRFRARDFVFLKPRKADELKNSNAFPGDLVFTHRGTLGQVGIVPEGPFERYVVSQSQMKLACDSAKANSMYVYYFFKSTLGQHALLMNTSQTRVPAISRPVSSLKAIRLALPPLGEQRAIAHILGTLDDKIELNRRLSETLEAMARALFKSWFVDFDPVRAKMEGRDTGLPTHIADLFPDRLVDSELGEIPEGWDAGTFRDVVEQVKEQQDPAVSPDMLFHHFSIPAFDEGRWPKPDLGQDIKSLKSKVQPGTILLSKLNPRIERVWLTDVEPTDRAICSTEFLVLHPRHPFPRSYSYCLSRSSPFRSQMNALVTGTSGSHQRAQVDAIMQLGQVLPDEPLVAAFDAVVSPLLCRSLACHRESRTLSTLRDTLLPKLISGELRVDPDRILSAVPEETPQSAQHVVGASA